MTRPLTRLDPGGAVPLLGGSVHYLRGGTDAICELEPENLAAHHRRLGARPDCRGAGGHELLQALDHTELTGRGGGHFPVAAKWRRVLETRLARPGPVTVVANGAEGEPQSRKDAALLELAPHLVLDGLACAAETVGATDAVLWLHEDAYQVRAAVTRAIAERSAHHPNDPRIRVALGPHHYLTGESSAVVNGLAGRPVRPALARVPAAESGVGERPTLVQNVESLARVALVARGHDVATVLLTVATDEQLVVVEHHGHASVQDVVTTTLGPSAPQAVLVGGYGGTWLSWADAAAPILAEGSAVSPGAGVIAPLPHDACGLARTADLADYLAASSARQCGPCHFGLPAIAGLMRELADTKAGRRDRRRLERFLLEVSGRGACHHPDGAVRLVASALELFADDVAAHLRGRCVHAGPRRG